MAAKATHRVQVVVDEGAAERTTAALHQTCDAANWLAGEMVATGVTNKIRLRRLYYSTLNRRFGLASERAVECISMVVEAYKRDPAVRPVFAVVEPPIATIPAGAAR